MAAAAAAAATGTGGAGGGAPVAVDPATADARAEVAAAAAAAAAAEAAAAAAAAAAAVEEEKAADAVATAAAKAVVDAGDGMSAAMVAMMAALTVDDRNKANRTCQSATTKQEDAKAALEAAAAAKVAAAGKAARAAAKAQEAATTAKEAKKTAAEASEFAAAQLTALQRVRELLIRLCNGSNNGHGTTPSSGTAGRAARAFGPQMDNHLVQYDDARVVTELLAATEKQLTTGTLGKLRGILANTGAASAVQLARDLAALPLKKRVEKPKRAVKGAVWVHRMWSALADEVTASLGDSFTGTIGYEVRLSTVYPSFSWDGKWETVSGCTSIADFAHIESADPTDGNVVNTRVKMELKRRWDVLLKDGLAQAEEQNGVPLLHMFTVHGYDRIIVVDGKWSYCIASDGYFVIIVRTSVDVDPGAPVVFLTTRVSPPLPLWPDDIMAAAYPEWRTIRLKSARGGGHGAAGGAGAAGGGDCAAGGDGAAAGGDSAAGGGGGGGDGATDGAAAAAATAAAKAAAAAAAADAAGAAVCGGVDIPSGLLVLACLFAVDRKFLGNREVPPPKEVLFTVPPHVDSRAPLVPPVPPSKEWAFVGAGGGSDVYRVRWNGTPCVVKMFRHATSHDASLWREAEAYRRLAGVTGVPCAHGGGWAEVGHNGARHLDALLLSPDGVVLHNILPGLSFLQRLAVVVHAAAAVLRALVAAHVRGVAHGDIRPPNVIVLPAAIAAAKGGAAAGAEFAVLSDWGCAAFDSAADHEKRAADVYAALALLHVALPDTTATTTEDDDEDVCDAIVAELGREELSSAAKTAVEAGVSSVYGAMAATADELRLHMEPLAATLAPYLPTWPAPADGAVLA